MCAFKFTIFIFERSVFGGIRFLISMIDVINVLTIVNLGLLAIFMGVKKVNTTINRIFALIIFTPATDFIINYLVYKGWIDQVPYLVFLNFSFLWGPMLMWYLQLMLGYRVRLSFITFIHLIPQLISWIFWIYAFAQGREYVDNIFRDRAAYNYPPAIIFLQIVVLSQIFGYTIYGAILVNKHKKDSGSSITEGKIKWLRQFVSLLVILGLLSIICALLFSSADNDNILVPLLYTVVYFMIVYSSFQSFGVFPDSKQNIHVRQEVIDDGAEVIPVAVSESGTYNGIAAASTSIDSLTGFQKTPYEKSMLKPGLINSYKEHLSAYLISHEPYTDPALTLTGLSKMLDIPSHHLSQTINQAMQKNFADLVNSYRVEKSKQLLRDPATSKLTLEAVGMQSGFGSSSAFYRAFKKFTGLTPKDFLKSNKVE
ncbi:MAG: AraC family transcriptional regulator [Sphingobacteriales bacterium]|nr:MAG: AraC family transcriptional regulator [Sphingobacteriales bacterium]